MRDDEPCLPAGRLPLDHDRAQALGRPVHRSGETGRPGADDHRVVRLGGASSAARAARRPRAALAGPASGRPPGARGVAVRRQLAPQSAAASLASGVIHSNVIWLRSRKRRRSRRPRPSGARRGARGLRRLRGDALKPPMRSRASPPTCSATRARRRRRRSTRCVDVHDSRRPVARKPLGNDVPSVIGTSPKIAPGTRSPSTRSIPSTTLTTSMLPSSTTKSARSSPSCTAYSPAARLMSADVRESRSRSAAVSDANSGTSAISSLVTMRRPERR